MIYLIQKVVIHDHTMLLQPTPHWKGLTNRIKGTLFVRSGGHCFSADQKGHSAATNAPYPWMQVAPSQKQDFYLGFLELPNLTE